MRATVCLLPAGWLTHAGDAAKSGQFIGQLSWVTGDPICRKGLNATLINNCEESLLLTNSYFLNKFVKRDTKMNSMCSLLQFNLYKFIWIPYSLRSSAALLRSSLIRWETSISMVALLWLHLLSRESVGLPPGLSSCNDRWAISSTELPISPAKQIK